MQDAAEQHGSERIEPELIVADSFRVREHRGVAEVRGFSHHCARFVASARSAREDLNLSFSFDELLDFLAASIEQITHYGAGNPRLELWGGGDGNDDNDDNDNDNNDNTAELRLSLRPLPPLGTSLDLRVAASSDSGQPALWHPERKGGNIARFASLNQSLGAEALLTDDGAVTEGATTALIWWDGDRGRVAESKQRVRSVAELLLHNIATERGEPFVPARVTPAELSSCEVWAVNALHGVRTVTRIDGVALPAPDPHRLHAYTAAFDQTWEPVRVPEIWVR